MAISLMNDLSNGFTKWSDVNRAGHNDGEPGGVIPIPIADPPADNPPVDDPTVTPEQPHQPWLVPGTGGSF